MRQLEFCRLNNNMLVVCFFGLVFVMFLSAKNLERTPKPFFPLVARDLETSFSDPCIDSAVARVFSDSSMSSRTLL